MMEMRTSWRASQRRAIWACLAVRPCPCSGCWATRRPAVPNRSVSFVPTAARSRSNTYCEIGREERSRVRQGVEEEEEGDVAHRTSWIRWSCWVDATSLPVSQPASSCYASAQGDAGTSF